MASQFLHIPDCALQTSSTRHHSPALHGARLGSLGCASGAPHPEPLGGKSPRTPPSSQGNPSLLASEQEYGHHKRQLFGFLK